MNAGHRLLRFRDSVIVAILLLAAMQGSRAQDDETTIQDSGVAHTRVTRHVANNGVDTPECGSRRSPCRTISQGIVNSAAGGLVLVGPGLYGDLDGSCTFDVVPEEGEEFGNTLCDSPGRICLDKEVTVASVAGAEGTVIDVCGYPFGVIVRASNSGFGLPHRGFTLINATSASVALAATNVTISGNIARPDRLGSGFQIESGDNVRVIGNLARDGSRGFNAVGVGSTSGLQITDNVAVSNDEGFRLVSEDPALVRRNVAISNNIGFRVFRGGHILRRNSVIGNRNYGIWITGGPAPLIGDNNIFGNNNVPRDGNVNCGILNETNLNIDATNNFWGASTGPGADPADEACDVGGGQIIHTPFAMKEFRFRHKVDFSKSTPEDES